MITKVFKFGGASIKDATAIRRMTSIIKDHYKNGGLLVVVSAMGKTTNALEELLKLWYNRKEWEPKFEAILGYHDKIIRELFKDNTGLLDEDLKLIIRHLREFLEANERKSYNYHYDQLVSSGEILSSTIISHYLSMAGIPSHWVDARQIIKTNDTYREAEVDWESTTRQIVSNIKTGPDDEVVITQGFIGGVNNTVTTLGREGSDYTAAIFACALQTESVTIWKDVPGILNADPKLISETVLYDELPYKEAAEMTYYGAKVIHPKTIKPLANENIPLFVRSFQNPREKGTCIHNCEVKDLTPAVIFKEEQCIFSFKMPEFDFVNEKNFKLIFETLESLNINIYMMQNSAISVTVVMDYVDYKIEQLINKLQPHFELYYNTGLSLLTIKNYQPEVIEKYIDPGRIILEQRSRHNFRALLQDGEFRASR